jgi:hypothetical protein
MKLADMRPAGEKRIEEMYGSQPGARDEEEDELHATEDELGHEDHVADAEADELDVADDELAMDEPMAEPLDAPLDDLGAKEAPPLDPEAQAVLATGMRAMADAMGIGDLVTVDVEPADAEVEDIDVTDVDVTDVDVVEPELGGTEGGDAISLEPDEPMMEETDELEESNEEDIVAEVARRVAARLQREAKQTEVVDQLAERIMKRLTK